MTADAPGSRINFVNGVPAQNGFATVPFVVDVPRVAVERRRHPQPARPSSGATASSATACSSARCPSSRNTYNYVIAGVDMQGMSDVDSRRGGPASRDLSKFHLSPSGSTRDS